MLIHKDSILVTDAALDALPLPSPRGRSHKPVPHGELVHALRATAAVRGYSVLREQLALNRSSARLFGVMDLRLVVPTTGQEADHLEFAIGFRNSTDESLGIRLVAGVRVMVCDNLALSGDLIALKRRNTTGLDLPAALEEGFDRYLEHTRTLYTTINAWQTVTLSTQAAKAQLFDLFAHKVLPLRLLGPVTRYYFNPDESMSDCHPRTMWALHNAVTRALKILPPVRAFEINVAVGRAFCLGQLRVH